MQNSFLYFLAMKIVALWHAFYETAFGKAIDRFCAWIFRAWNESMIVTLFATPHGCGYDAKPHCGKVRLILTKLYEKCKLNRVLNGSIFLHGYFWCGIAVVIAPFAPTIAVLGAALVGICTEGLYLLQKKELSRPSPLLLPVFVFLAFYLIGTVFSMRISGSIYVAALTVAFVLFSVVFYRTVESRSQLDWLITAFVTVAAAVSAYGILQYVFGWGYQSAAWVDEEMFDSLRFRVASTMQNPNMLGQYLVLMLPLGFAKLLTDKGALWKIYDLLCCGAIGVCLILTFSRGAWLAFLAAAVVMLLLLRPRLFLLAPIALIALWFLLPDSIINRFTSIGDLGDSSTSYRVFIWLGSIRMLLDGHWLTGIGPGEEAFHAVYPLYAYNGIVAPHSHNLFLQMLCDGGIGTLLTFLWVQVRYFRLNCRTLRESRDGKERILTAAFTAGTVGFLVQAMTDYSFYNHRVMFLFWAYLTVGTLCAKYRECKEGGLKL